MGNNNNNNNNNNNKNNFLLFIEKEATVNTSIYIVKFFLIILLFLSLRTIRRYVTQLKNSFQKKNIFPSTASYNKNNRAYLTFGRLNREFKINLNITKHQKNNYTRTQFTITTNVYKFKNSNNLTTTKITIKVSSIGFIVDEQIF